MQLRLIRRQDSDLNMVPVALGTKTFVLPAEIANNAGRYFVCRTGFSCCYQQLYRGA